MFTRKKYMVHPCVWIFLVNISGKWVLFQYQKFFWCRVGMVTWCSCAHFDRSKHFWTVQICLVNFLERYLFLVLFSYLFLENDYDKFDSFTSQLPMFGYVYVNLTMHLIKYGSYHIILLIREEYRRYEIPQVSGGIGYFIHAWFDLKANLIWPN